MDRSVTIALVIADLEIAYNNGYSDAEYKI